MKEAEKQLLILLFVEICVVYESMLKITKMENKIIFLKKFISNVRSLSCFAVKILSLG